jgi:hypothetical protein
MIRSGSVEEAMSVEESDVMSNTRGRAVGCGRVKGPTDGDAFRLFMRKRTPAS